MKALLPVDTEVVVSGKFSRRYNEIQATDYEFELFEEENLIHTNRIVPKYPLTAKLTAKMLRAWMRTALDEHGQQIPEIFPLALRTRQNLIDRQSAINEIHFPTSEAHREAAQKRLAFEEFFLLSIGMEMKKERRISEDGIAFRVGMEGNLKRLVPYYGISSLRCLTNSHGHKNGFSLRSKTICGSKPS